MAQHDQFSGEPALPDSYAYAYQPSGHQPPVSGLAIAAFVVACSFGLLMIVSNLSAGPAIADLEDARASGSYDDTWAQVYDGTALALWPGMAVVWVVTCIWLTQARKHVEAVNPHYVHRRRVGWVWAGWLVPIVSLWFPNQVVRDIYGSVTRYRVPAVMGWWWGLWLVMLLANRVLDRLTDNQLGSLDFDSGPVVVLGAIAAMATLGALVAWGLTIRHVVAALNRADRVSPPASSPTRAS